MMRSYQQFAWQCSQELQIIGSDCIENLKLLRMVPHCIVEMYAEFMLVIQKVQYPK
jgi:hypothetical protein